MWFERELQTEKVSLPHSVCVCERERERGGGLFFF